MLLLAALLAATAPASVAPAATTGVSSKPAPTKTVPKPRPTRAQVTAAVHAEWAKYDIGMKGKLTPLEFTTWVMEANGAKVAPAGSPKGSDKGISPVSAMNAASPAFARADANHDGGITPQELVSFLMRRGASSSSEQSQRSQ